VALGDDVELAVAAAFCEALGCEAVDRHASFFDLGGHSLRAIQLLDRLDVELGKRITLPTLHGAPSVVELSEFLRDGKTTEQYEYLLPIHPHGTRTPIFGIHVLGKNGEYFRPLAARLGSDQPFYGLGLASLTPDVDAPTEVADIAAAYRSELDRVVPVGPVALAAISLGSIVAVELAQQLRTSGREVSLLVMLDARGPGVSAPIDNTGRVQAHLVHLQEHGLKYVTETLSNKATELREKVGLKRIALNERLGRPVPRSLRVLQFVHANYASQFAYEMKPYDSPIVVLCADDEKFWDPEIKARGLGWDTIAEGPLYVDNVPGNHLGMLEEPNVPVLAHKLTKLMDSLD
jgi:thioesterase domain-containing protein/acyl carrier protein